MYVLTVALWVVLVRNSGIALQHVNFKKYKVWDYFLFFHFQEDEDLQNSDAIQPITVKSDSQRSWYHLVCGRK